MNNNQFPQISTERLLLRRLQESDWKQVSFLRTDKEVNKYVDRPDAKTKEEALQFIEKIDMAIDKLDSYYWAITMIGNDEMIGSISLWQFSPDRKTAEVGYDLNPKYHKKGLMNEALASILHFGFSTLQLDMIEARTHRQNEASKNLLKKNNFKLMEEKTDEDNENNLIFEIENPKA